MNHGFAQMRRENSRGGAERWARVRAIGAGLRFGVERAAEIGPSAVASPGSWRAELG